MIGLDLSVAVCLFLSVSGRWKRNSLVDGLKEPGLRVDESGFFCLKSSWVKLRLVRDLFMIGWKGDGLDAEL